MSPGTKTSTPAARPSTAAPRRPVVGHVLPWSGVAGTEWGTLRLIQAVGDADFAHVAFIPGGAGRLDAFLTAHGIPTVEYEAEEPSFRRPLPFLRSSLALRRLFRAHGVDLIHCADLAAAYHVSVAGVLAAIPVTTHIRCQHPSVPGRYRLILRGVRHYAFVSEDARRSFGGRVPPDGATVVADAIDVSEAATASAIDLRERLGLPGDAVLVGMVARVAPAKDFTTLIEALARVRDRRHDVYFVIIGDHSSAGTYRAHYQWVLGVLEERGLTGAMRFAGELPGLDGIWPQLQASVLVTHTEGLPLVLLESMAAGCPVVATTVGGVPELVQDGVNGFTHSPGDAAELATKLLRLLDEPETARSLAETARRDVVRRYSYERLGSIMRDLFTRALTGA